MPQIFTRAYPGVPGTMIYGGVPSQASGTVLSTVVLHNFSASPQAGGFVTPMFGVPFRQGDLPYGQFPQFALDDDTECHATIWNVVRWPDGSMKFCGAMARIPASVQASGSINLHVLSGGAAMGTSGRTVANLTGLDLKIRLTGVANLSGQWLASLTEAIATGNDITLIGDGEAGAVWRIGGDFKQSSAAHGQLYAWHYVAALQDGSGQLLGVRYLGRVTQPWVDAVSPPAAKRDMNVDLMTGVSVARALQGQQSGGLTNVVTLPHYASFFTCGQTGKWDYFQGAGSAAADCTIRVVHTPAHLIRSRLVLPYDTSLSNLQPYAGGAKNYNPGCTGLMTSDTGTTGERADIGVLAGWHAKHAIDPTPGFEQDIRVCGLAVAGWRASPRVSTTRQVLPVVDIRSNYAGLGQIHTDWWYWSYNTDIPNPIGEGHIWAGEEQLHHRPSGAYYPYLITGEPQYLDTMTEHAAESIACTYPGSTTEWKTTLPITGNARGAGDFASRTNVIAGVPYKGSALLFQSGLPRYQAWHLRDVAQCVALYPDACPYSTETKLYLKDVLESNYAALNAYNNVMPQSWRDHGLFALSDFNTLGGLERTWCLSYLALSVAHASTIEPSNGSQQCRQHFSRYYASVHSLYDIAAVGSNNCVTYTETGNRITSLTQALWQVNANTLVTDASTNRVTISGSNGAWRATNGDRFLLPPQFVGVVSSAGASEWTRAYVVNAVGATFQLSLTEGGAPVTLVNGSWSDNYTWMAGAEFRPGLSYDGGASEPLGWTLTAASAIGAMAAAGESNLSGAWSRIFETTRTLVVPRFEEEPRNAVINTYPT